MNNRIKTINYLSNCKESELQKILDDAHHSGARIGHYFGGRRFQVRNTELKFNDFIKALEKRRSLQAKTYKKLRKLDPGKVKYLGNSSKIQVILTNVKSVISNFFASRAYRLQRLERKCGIRKAAKTTRIQIKWFFPFFFTIKRLKPSQILKGSGPVKSEKRSVKSFDTIEAKGVIDIVVKQGKESSVTVEGQENLLKHIQTRSNNNTLIITLKNNRSFSTNKKLTVYVTTPNLKKISHSGTGSIKSDGVLKFDSLTLKQSGTGSAKISLNGNTLHSQQSGTGSVKLAGRVSSQNVNVSGTGSYEASALKSKKAVVKASGIGNAKINVSNEIQVTQSGLGKIKVVKTPKICRIV